VINRDTFHDQISNHPEQDSENHCNQRSEIKLPCTVRRSRKLRNQIRTLGLEILWVCRSRSCTVLSRGRYIAPLHGLAIAWGAVLAPGSTLSNPHQAPAALPQPHILLFSRTITTASTSPHKMPHCRDNDPFEHNQCSASILSHHPPNPIFLSHIQNSRSVRKERWEIKKTQM
jgi:hypothetical protein